MKGKITLLTILTILGTLNSVSALHNEFYSYTDCKDFDNSELVQNISIDFKTIPESGRKTKVVAKGDLLRDVHFTKVYV